jgi:hypothetical protein
MDAATVFMVVTDTTADAPTGADIVTGIKNVGTLLCALDERGAHSASL